MKSILFLLFPVICLGLRGREITENVIAFQGIPYGRQPIGKYRFEESIPIAFSEDLPVSWKRCLSTKVEAGRGEDCLFLSLYRDKSVEKKTKTLLLVTNDKLDDQKVAGLVTVDLNIVVASVRDGVLSSFGGAPYGVSDVVSLFTFLKTNAEKLLIGNITVWSEGSLAETVAAAQNRIDVTRAILINGFANSRTFEREKYGARAVYKLRTETECDLPSFDQSVDCLRSKSIEELMEKTDLVVKSFSPFGNPFRSPRGYVPEKALPTIIGVYGDLSKDYPSKDEYPADYSTKDFKQFLAALIPNSLHQNAPLLRRLIMHQYIYSLGNKLDTYFLYQSSRNILLDRDFRVPIQQFIDHYVRHNRKLWVLEYNIDTTQPGCLSSETDEQYSAFCERLLAYFTRFATHGAPTSESCDPKNPTFPFMGGSKRLYFVRLTADGQSEWEFNYHKPAVELWNQLLPSLDTLELAGRRDAQFEEEKEIDPLEVEDDVQLWHEKAESDQTVLTEEKALNDMPYKQEL